MIVVIVIAVAGGAVYLSPSVAEEVLPASVLSHHPQFEAVETDISCDLVEQVEEGEESIRGLLGDDGDPQTRDAACGLVCGGEDAYAGDYCDADDEFVCVCRVDDGTDDGLFATEE